MFGVQDQVQERLLEQIRIDAGRAASRPRGTCGSRSPWSPRSARRSRRAHRRSCSNRSTRAPALAPGRTGGSSRGCREADRPRVAAVRPVAARGDRAGSRASESPRRADRDSGRPSRADCESHERARRRAGKSPRTGRAAARDLRFFVGRRAAPARARRPATRPRLSPVADPAGDSAGAHGFRRVIERGIRDRAGQEFCHERSPSVAGGLNQGDPSRLGRPGEPSHGRRARSRAGPALRSSGTPGAAPVSAITAPIAIAATRPTGTPRRRSTAWTATIAATAGPPRSPPPPVGGAGESVPRARRPDRARPGPPCATA